jgi:hypothetical protein
MRLERLPAGKAAAGDGVPLDVADAPLGLALGPRPVRRAGARPEAPVPGEGQELRIEDDRPGLGIVLGDQSRGLSKSTSSGTPPKAKNALSMPSNQLSCRSWRNARTCSRRE